MDVKQAVSTAKAYVGDLFADEGVLNLGLEEVQRDDTQGEWLVTLGFSRPWDLPQSNAVGKFLGALEECPRSFKIVRISDQTGHVVSVTNR